VLIVPRFGVLCVLMIVKLALIECAFRISGHNQISEDFETMQEKLTTYSISTECFKAVVAGLWPCGYLVGLAFKNISNSRLTIFRSVPAFLL